MNGWLKIHRNLINWEWFTSPKHLLLFMTILLRVNHKKTRWRNIEVAEGQLITGTLQLSSWTGLGRQSIRTILKDLETSGELTIKTTNKFSIITVTKWHNYQIDDALPTNKADSKTTIKQPSTNHQLTTSKNEKNEKNEKNISSEIEKADFSMNDLIQCYNNIMPSNKRHKSFTLSSGAISELKKTTGFRPFNLLETWREIFTNVSTSKFGKNNFVRLHWLVQYDNAQKVYENNYCDNSKPSGPSLAEQAKELEAELKAKGEW